MNLEWSARTVGDGDGNKIRLHYLVDNENQQCLALVTEPRDGCLLFVTDLRIAGVDRSWMTLDAAKEHCESAVELENCRLSTELEELINPPKPVARTKPIPAVTHAQS